jgi:hypothetical protein
LKATAHHPDSGKDEAAETDNGTCVNRESFEGAHQGLRSREIHRSLGMSNAGECKGDQSRPHHARGTE